MKSSKVFLGMAIAAAISVTSMQAGLWAAPAPKLAGPFEVKPQVVHRDAIAGTMTITQSATKVTGIKLDLDKPVYGRPSFASSEQWSATPGEGSAQQLVVAFKLQGPPHAWYFVFVGTSADGGLTENGSIYRVDATLPQIQAAAQAIIPAQPGTGWKAVGTATLKAQ
jgi:hypothetical protein